MTMQTHHLPDGPPVFDVDKVRALWAAAKADYLAGGSGPEVCERYGLILRTFRDRASKEGWRRADQPSPAPALSVQNDPLVIPEAPEALSGAPLTASEMVDKAWSHVQAAVAAGQLIQARGWLRLYKELKLHVPFAEMEARRAAAEAGRAAEAVAPPLHCFSPPECDDAPSTPSPSGLTGGSRHADGAELAPHPSAFLDSPVRPGNDGRVEAGGQNLAPPLHCFSPPECNAADDLTRLAAELKALTGKGERAVADEAVAPPLHCFSAAERNTAGQGP
jgi:hypothetical protein